MRIINDTLAFLAPIGPEAFQFDPTGAMVVKAAFKLKPDAAAEWLEEPLPAKGDELHMDDIGRSLAYASDMVVRKHRLDLLVTGHCHAPQGEPVTEARAAVAFGDWRKELVVTGKRLWVDDGAGGLRMTEPAAFTKVPLRYELAYGGLMDTENPGGLGQDDIPLEEGDGTERPLPQIEDPNDRVSAPDQRVKLAGFAPLAPHYGERARKMGTRDHRWAVTRAPKPPKDMDPTHTNAAPADQQFPLAPGLRGDEPLTFENMHPEHPVYRTRLHALRPRLFATKKVPRALDFFEIPLTLDTILADLDEEIGILVFRGPLTFETPVGSEFRHFCLAMEGLDEPAGSVDAYRDHYLKRIQEEEGEDTEVAIELEAMAKMQEGFKMLEEGGLDPAFMAELKQVKDPQKAYEMLDAHLQEIIKRGYL